MGSRYTSWLDERSIITGGMVMSLGGREEL